MVKETIKPMLVSWKTSIAALSAMVIGVLDMASTFIDSGEIDNAMLAVPLRAVPHHGQRERPAPTGARGLRTAARAW